jgi:hypothetical protein
VLKQARLIIISFSWQFVSGCRWSQVYYAALFSCSSWSIFTIDSNGYCSSSTASSGLLSSRHPRNDVWRSCSSSVHSAKATSQTNFGLTHWIFSGILGGFSTVGLSVKSGSLNHFTGFISCSYTISNASGPTLICPLNG